MHRLCILLALILFVIVIQTASAHDFTSFNPDPALAPPAGDSRRFQLRADYPASLPTPTVLPWEDPSSNPFIQTNPVDRATHAERYMQRVLQYALDGNDSANFVPQANTQRNWYQAPWLHASCFGREYINGFTIERFSEAGELSPGQTRRVTNWGGGFYNDIGAYTLGQVWGDGSPGAIPQDSRADFHNGTVAIKLLFTTATDTEVPYLADSIEFDVDARRANDTCGSGPTPSPPIPGAPAAGSFGWKVRLLQFDFAVRDTRATGTEWVFGTFVYDASLRDPSNPVQTAWDRLQPVGLMWGTDPTVNAQFLQDGAFINTALQETWINPTVIPVSGQVRPTDQALMTHLGMGGRLNGSVDAPTSACLSCHGRSGWPRENRSPNGVDLATQYPADQDTFDRYFALVPPGAHVDVIPKGDRGPVTATTTTRRHDYSLQTARGREEYATCHKTSHAGTPTPTPAAYCFPAGTPMPLVAPQTRQYLENDDIDDNGDPDVPEITRNNRLTLIPDGDRAVASLGTGAIVAVMGLIGLRRRR